MSNMTLRCTDCDEDNDWDDTLTHTWLQWECRACSQWHDWKDGQYDELYQEYKETWKVGDHLYVQEARCDCSAKRGDRHLPACPHLFPKEIPTQPSNSRYNVANMQGNAIPDELIAAFSKEVKAIMDEVPAENMLGFLKPTTKWAVSIVARTTYVVQASSAYEAEKIARSLASGESVTIEAIEPYPTE